MLTAFSLLFYLYAGIVHFWILIALGVCNYIFYRLLHSLGGGRDTARKIALCLGVAANLSVLFYYKYYNFLVDNLNFLFKAKFQITSLFMPLGISFITFQNIAFLVDVYRRDIGECSVLDYAFYLSYFPKISSGPITLFGDLARPKLRQDKEEFWDNVASGFYLFVMGLGKKVLIADALAKVTEAGYRQVGELNTPTALLVSLAYTFQIYYDFSGYSDMAIGISRMLQIKLADNFHSPYKARTIEEFWERWHISLTKFFTKYLYIPLGGSRKGKGRTYLNIFIIFLCSGLWHGASWTYILWGAIHGTAMILTRRFKHIWEKIPCLMSQILTFLFLNFTMIVLRAGNFHTLKGMYRAILRGGWGMISSEVCSDFMPEWLEQIWGIDVPDAICVVGFLALCGFMVFGCQNAKKKADEKHFSVWNAVWTLAVFMVCLLSFSHITTYIYDRF